MKKDNFFDNYLMYDLEEFDKPKYAILEYENGILIYEDYTNLDTFLESLIDDNANTSSISIHSLLIKKLNSIELKYAVKFFKERSIEITGYSSKIELSDLGGTNTIKKSFYTKYSSFTEEEQTEKLKEYKNETDEKRKLQLRNEIIEKNMRFVETIVYRYNYPSKLHLSGEEIINMAIFGLIKAIDKYDYTKGKFPQFAAYYIRREINVEYSKTLDSLTQIFTVYFKKARKVIEERYNEEFNGQEYMLNEIMEYLIDNEYIDNNHYDSIKEAIVFLYPESINEIEIVSNVDYSVIALTNVIKEKLYELIDSLDYKHRVIIKLRNKIVDDEVIEFYKKLKEFRVFKQKEIGEIFGITKNAISQIEINLYKRLKKDYSKMFLEDINNIGKIETGSNEQTQAHKKLLNC